MRFESIKIRGIGPFASEQHVDLAALPGITAVVGENGAGKSMLLGSLAGAIYRELPRRRSFESLASVAVARDAYIEVVVCNGQRYTVRQTCDHLSGKSETLVLNEAGVPQLDSAKVTDGDRWIASHFPLSEVLYAGPFAPQGKRTSFLDMGKGERKALLVQLLGLQQYERMAAEATTRAGSARADLALLRGRLSALPAVNLEALLEEALACQGRAVAATEAVELARRSLERARAASGDAERARELVEQRQAVERRLEVAVGQIAETQARIANNRGLLNRAEEIRSAETRAEEIKGELATIERETTEANAALREHSAKNEAAEKASFEAANAMRASERRVSSVEARLANRSLIEAGVAESARLAELIPDLEADHEKASAEVARLQRLLLAGKDERIAALRTGLETIADVPDPDLAPLNVWARNTLANDNGRAAEAARAPDDLKRAEEKMSSARAAVSRTSTGLSNARSLAARLPEIEAAERDLIAAKTELEQADEAARTTLRARDASRVPHPAEGKPLALLARKVELTDELAKLKPTVDLVKHLEQAQALITERERQLAQQQETKAQAERELAALPVIELQQVDVGGAERDLRAKEQAEREAHAAQTRAQDAAKLGEETLAKRATAESAIAAGESLLSDFVRLSQDLGRDGLQAFLIDAALPELNATINHLLHTTLGTRWTVQLMTDRLASDGKKSIEGLPVLVLDTQNGREADADTYSGGEHVLINEACSLALTMLACRRAGIERPTIVRDESGAALSPERARQYVAMLRLACKQLDAAGLLLVSHSTEVQELCDHQIRIADGKIEVVS